MARVMTETGAEVVLGSRWLGSVESIPPMRKLVLRAAVVFTPFSGRAKT